MSSAHAPSNSAIFALQLLYPVCDTKQRKQGVAGDGAYIKGDSAFSKCLHSAGLSAPSATGKLKRFLFILIFYHFMPIK
jgi:hypothetical protein